MLTFHSWSHAGFLFSMIKSCVCMGGREGHPRVLYGVLPLRSFTVVLTPWVPFWPCIRNAYCSLDFLDIYLLFFLFLAFIFLCFVNFLCPSILLRKPPFHFLCSVSWPTLSRCFRDAAMYRWVNLFTRWLIIWKRICWPSAWSRRLWLTQ